MFAHKMKQISLVIVFIATSFAGSSAFAQGWGQPNVGQYGTQQVDVGGLADQIRESHHSMQQIYADAMQLRHHLATLQRELQLTAHPYKRQHIVSQIRDAQQQLHTLEREYMQLVANIQRIYNQLATLSRANPGEQVQTGLSALRPVVRGNSEMSTAVDALDTVIGVLVQTGVID